MPVSFSCAAFLFLGILTSYSDATGNVPGATAFYDSSGKILIKPGTTNAGAAWATFNDSIEESGWSILNVRAGYGTEEKYSDDQLMFAAGYLEGALSHTRIYQYYVNARSFLINDKETEMKIRDWMKKQTKWMIDMINENKDDSFWRQVGFVYTQFQGLVKGYQAYCPKENMLDEFALQLISAGGDFFDLPAIVNGPNASKSKDVPLGHCSVIIKVLPGYEDILAGHSTWFMYQTMLRVYKHYDFNLEDPSTAAKGVSFSSYPGSLVSIDDFYLLSSGLVMLQTTNDIFNKSLYDVCTPESLLAWHRVRVANAMANGSKMWTDIVAKYNSGTYNNQYMVLDLNRIKLREKMEDGALYVAEQIPGLVLSADVTPILREGYWASYNIPYFEQIYNLSGYSTQSDFHSVGYSYELAPRAEIFRRDAAKITDVTSLKALLRYNNYEKEEYADGDPCHTICCRRDLNQTASPVGCTDTKVTNYEMALSRQAEGISGPTTEGGLPVFSWNLFPNASHLGMPISWDFDFVFMSPSPQV